MARKQTPAPLVETFAFRVDARTAQAAKAAAEVAGCRNVSEWLRVVLDAALEAVLYPKSEEDL
jgi:hypothetical protein